MLIKDIIPQDELDILKKTKTKKQIIAIAQQKLKEKQQKPKTTTIPQNEYDDNSTSSSIVRGLAEASSRGVALADNITNQFDFSKDWIGDEFANKNTKMLNHLEDVKQKTSRKGLSKERLAELDTLDKQNAKANGIWENTKAVGATLYDTATHPKEWTIQGIVAGATPTDPANLLGFATGGVGGKIISSTLGKIGFGIVDGAATNSFVEYNVAKGTGKSDEEADKIAIQGGIGGGAIPAAFATTGAFAKVPKIATNTKIDSATADKLTIQTANEKVKESLGIINEAEQNATQSHDQTKAKLEEMKNNGATLDEMIAFKDNIPVSEADKYTSRIINDGEDMTPDVVGYKIVNVMEDTIKNNTLTADEVYKKLTDKNVNQELAKVAAKSYKLKNTDILVEYISNKTAEHLETTNQNYKDQVQQKIDIHNKQIIADDLRYSKSLEKKQVDNFIKDEIGKEYINKPQLEMIHELNKIGLVEELKSEDIKQKFKKDDKFVYHGAYDGKDITIDNTISKLNKAQTLTHEYLHSATDKLLNHKPFYNEIKKIMEAAKRKSKNKSHNGYKNVREFIPEALSDPYLAKELNDMALTPELKKRYGAKEHIQSVWDLIVDKFSEVVYLATGKEFKINKNSYFGALNKSLSKQMKELEDIKKQRLENGESFKNKANDKTDDVVYQAKELEQNYMKDGLVDEQTIYEIAELMPNTISKDAFIKQFEINKKGIATIKSVVGDISIKPKYAYEHLTDNTHLQDRTQFSGAFLSTIKEPLFVVKDKYKGKNVKVFYKPFKKDNKLLHLVGYAIDTKGQLINSTFFDIKPNKLKKYIETNDNNLEYYRYSKTSLQDEGSPNSSQNLSTPENKQTSESVKNEYLNYKGKGGNNPPHHKNLPSDKNIIPQKTKKNQGQQNGNIKNKARDNKNLGSTTKNDDSTATTKQRSSNSHDDGADTLFSRTNDELSTKDKPMGGRSTSTDTKPDFHKFDKDEVVPTKAKTFKEVKQKSLWQKYEAGVDKVVDAVFEKALMGTLEKLSLPIKATADAMTGFKHNIMDKNWFTVTDTQKAVNSVVNDFNNLKTDIYSRANEVKSILQNLGNDKGKELLKVLNGDMKLKELSDDLKPLYKTFRDEIDNNANELVKLGILKEDEKIKDYVKRYYTKYLEDSGEIKAIKSKAFEKFHKRKDLDYDTRVKLGMVEDAGLVIANTIAEQKTLIAKAKVLKTIADKWGNKKEVDGYARISDETVKEGVKKWGALAGLYVPNEIKKELLQSRVISSELRYWEDIQYGLVDHIKVNVTVKNPATHVYNIGSNISLSFISGDMVALGKTLKMMVSNKDEFKSLVKRANKLGLDSQLDDIENPMVELHKNSKKTNIALTIAKNIYMTQDSKVGKNIRKLYDWEDKIFKLARFKKLLDEGMEEKAAFADAMATYVDYRTPAPAGLRWLDKGGLMPFLHYQYKATPQVAKTIAKNPIKALIMGTGIASIGGLRWQDEDDKYYKPDWMADKTIGNQFFTKEWVKVGNSGYYWNIGRLIPGTKFDFDFGGFMKGLMYISDGRSPLGYEVVKKGEDVLYFKRLQLLMKNYTPPLSFGRYGQRLIDIGLGDAGVKEAPKNPVTKKADTVKDVALRGVGVRPVNAQKEYKNHYRKAKKEDDKDTMQKMKRSRVGFKLGDGSNIDRKSFDFPMVKF